MIVERVGFFSELDHGDDDGPSLVTARRYEASPHAEHIVAYLNAGALFIACAGITNDVLDPEHPIIGAPHIRTDGVYAWPADLAHYVAVHHVALPEAFVRHAEANGWRVPEGVDVTTLEL